MNKAAPKLYTELTGDDLLAIAKASGDEVHHLQMLVLNLVSAIKAQRVQAMTDAGVFDAIQAAAGDAMFADENDDCVVEVRR